jgi:hypothetical protein
MTTIVKHKKLSIKRAFQHLKPVSYIGNSIIGELMDNQKIDQETMVSRYMGVVKPKKKRGTKK